MNKGITLLVLFAITYCGVFSQDNDTILLKEIEIKSDRLFIKESQNLKSIQLVSSEIIKASSDSDISSCLKELSLVDIRQRSFSRVQSDISTRGGNFDQTMILLNGINLTDPQTGHHSLNIPINAHALEGIEIVYGSASRIFGANAFSGAVNFISRIPESNSFNLDLSYGSFNTTNILIGGDLILKGFKQTVSASYSQSDGFDYNTDYNSLNIYYENNFDLKLFKGKTMIGFLDKQFGSQSFYTPAFPDQFEKIRTGFAAIKLTGGKNIRWDYNLYYRGLKDQFQLFREGAGFYTQTDAGWLNGATNDTVSWYSGHNNHLTNIAGSGLDFSSEWFAGKTSLGVDFRYEQIYSNVLGLSLNQDVDDLYTKSDTRQNVSVFLNHGYYSKKFLVSLGGMAYYNQQYDWDFNYGLDAGYYIAENFLLKAGISKSMRLPTFTELYYQGPSNIGNPDLIPEQALSIETGIRYYIGKQSYFSFNAFSRDGDNIISWVREDDSSAWETENLTKLKTQGLEFTSVYKEFNSAFVLNYVSLAYAFIDQDKSAAGLDSKYTLDHMKHKLIFGLNHKIYKNISASWTMNLFQRNGEFMMYDRDLRTYTESTPYSLTTLLNLKVVADFKKLGFYASIYNITNSDYFDIGNVPTPGVSLMFGVKLKLGK